MLENNIDISKYCTVVISETNDLKKIINNYCSKIIILRATRTYTIGNINSINML